MNSIEQKLILNRKYIGAINTNNFKSSIYEYYSYNLKYLDNCLPTELILTIINKLCSLLIVVITYDNRLQYINPIDCNIIKEIKLKEDTNYYDYTNINISNDGLALIIYHDKIIVEYLYNTYVKDKYIFESNYEFHDNNYYLQDISISNSTKYFIKFDNKCNIGLYNTITGIQIANYIINEENISNICFSSDETKIVIITNKENNVELNYHLYVLSITSQNTLELLHFDDSLGIGNYSVLWCNNNLLLINCHTDDSHYTNATYSKLINIYTKETQTIMLPTQNAIIKWKNNNLLYIDDNKLYIYNTTQSVINNKKSVQYIKTYRDYYISNYYIFEETFIIKYTNRYGDDMILIDNKLSI